MKKTAKITILSILLLLTILWGASNYFLNLAFYPADNVGKNITTSWEYMYENYPYVEPWLDSLRHESALKDTFIYAPDGVKMHAYYVQAAKPTQKTALIIHGYTDNAIRMMMIGYMYNHDLGYNILLPDLRYTGLSEGDAIQMGWLEKKDVIQWMGVTKNIYGDSIQMVIHGISMGAATTMMVSGEELPPYVKCFVEDCGYTSVWDQFSKELKEDFSLPAFPLMYTASWLCKWRYGWSFKEASAMKQIAKCKRPMLFIHGDKDDYVPTYMVYELFEQKPDNKEIWVVPNIGHASAYKYEKKQYTDKVISFTEKYIQ
ncbi:MAG: alpha/beta hydrolase [Phocaeicola sp.]